MHSASATQILPRAGLQRRVLQEKGQFWTPPWVARAMASYVMQSSPTAVFDPAVGAGAFFFACRELGYQGRFTGCEPDTAALSQAQGAGLTVADLADVEVVDFFENSHTELPAIVSNPPYLRHHRIAASRKLHLQTHARALLGFDLDGRAGLHVHFLLHCLERLAPNGRLCFLLPADVAEGVFAVPLWSWITQHHCLEAVITFAPEATPFEGVDTNVIIVAIKRAAPQPDMLWARLQVRDDAALRRLLMGISDVPATTAEIVRRSISELVQTGLTRPLRAATEGLRFGDLARAMRGIATGANDFFFLTRGQMESLGLPPKYFLRAIGRTRDSNGERLSAAHLDSLDRTGRPTWLLNLPAISAEEFPTQVQAYLRKGEQQGLPLRPLIKSRKTWFRSEQRQPPPILFAYLGRRACRFILNDAGCLPLTGFLCVYPHPALGFSAKQLWGALNAPETQEQLARVGKSYGGGAIKVEPRALENLIIPQAVAERFGLRLDRLSVQLRLMESKAKYNAKVVRDY